jgi:hypothetical protein
VADWITRANDLEAAPALSGNPVVDALAAAATAHVAMTRGEHIPKWTNETDRAVEPLWYVGPPGFFANALVHSPLPFATRGVLIEADSLESV